jgi:hypothetical protein
MLLSSNHIKGSMLLLTYEEGFHLRVHPEDIRQEAIPLQNTEDFTTILDEVKEKACTMMSYSGNIG